MKRFAAYTRVSTGEQTSTDAQLQALYPRATAQGGTIVAVETDVLSGHEDRRVGYQRILEMARRHEIDGVLVWKLDRLGRNHVEGIRAANELEALGVSVYSATEPTDDPFVRDLLLLLANRESRVLAERVRLKQRANVQAGYWQWPPPPGYRVVHQTPEDTRNRRPKLEPNADAPLIRRVFELAATGGYSLRLQRDEAQAIGLTSTRGHVLSRTHVHQILTNPVYVGDIAYGRRPHGKFSGDSRKRPESDWLVVQNAHEAIVDRVTYEAVQGALARHKRFQGDVRGTTYLLTGLLYCGHCGSRMYGAKGGKGNFTYACSRGQDYGDCDLKSVGGKRVDAFIRTQLSRLVIGDEVGGQVGLAGEDGLSIALGRGLSFGHGGVERRSERRVRRRLRLDRRLRLPERSLCPGKLTPRLDKLSVTRRCLRLGFRKAGLQLLDVRVGGRELLFQENYLFIHTHHLVRFARL